MSDDGAAPTYKDQDIVWVKLGSCWWPGEVTENPPEDCTYKKPPLAIVKFFNEEDMFELVRNHNHIYPYNCKRKHEFIRKGMDAFRTKNVHMEKFPVDVTTAETRTDGNPNILSDPILQPQKKISIIQEVFGTPSPKKTPKDGAKGKGGGRGRPSTSKSGKKSTGKVNITHRRFLGCDDYQSHILEQYPGKDANKDTSEEDEDFSYLTDEPIKTYPCSACTFQTARLEVMLYHVRCHINGVQMKPLPTPVKKSSAKKPKKIVSKIVLSGEEILFDSSDDEEVKPKQKRKRKPQDPSKKRMPKNKMIAVEEEPDKKDKSATDIQTDLLAEWSDSDGLEEESETSAAKINISGESKEDGQVEKSSSPKQNNTVVASSSKKPDADQNGPSSKSCFDFEEDEDLTSAILPSAPTGRKIPRVIPPSDTKRKSSDPDDEDASLPIAEDDENRMEVLKVTEVTENSETRDEPQKEEEEDPKIEEEPDETFKELMDSTNVPELPSVPSTLKPTQNFPEADAIKTPDKSTEVATKLTNPKKRFVKSFEDFEQLQNEQRKAQEEMKGKEVNLEVIEQEESISNEINVDDYKMEADIPATKEAENRAPEKAEMEAIEEAAKKAVEEANKKAVEEAADDAIKKAVEDANNKVLEGLNKKAAEEANKRALKEEHKKVNQDEGPNNVDAEPSKVNVRKRGRGRWSKNDARRTSTKKPVEVSDRLSSAKKPKTDVDHKVIPIAKEDQAGNDGSSPSVPEQSFDAVKVKSPSKSPKRGAAPQVPSDTDQDLQIARLKGQIMSKLVEEEKIPVHRTPRRKILESYQFERRSTRQSTEGRGKIEEVIHLAYKDDGMEGPSRDTDSKSVAETVGVFQFRNKRVQKEVASKVPAEDPKEKPKKHVAPKVFLEEPKEKPKKDVAPKVSLEEPKEKPKKDVAPKVSLEEPKEQPRKDVARKVSTEEGKEKPKKGVAPKVSMEEPEEKLKIEVVQELPPETSEEEHSQEIVEQVPTEESKANHYEPVVPQVPNEEPEQKHNKEIADIVCDFNEIEEDENSSSSAHHINEENNVEPPKGEDVSEKAVDDRRPEVVVEAQVVVENKVPVEINNPDEKLGDLVASQSNLPEEPTEVSGLETLAMVSELDIAQPIVLTEETVETETVEEEIVEVETTELPPEPDIPKIVEEHFAKKSESEIVSIDGNLTVVTEKDLAFGQVEITASACVLSSTPSDPFSLKNFSMDFESSPSSSATKQAEETSVKQPEPVIEDLEEQIPSQILDKKTIMDKEDVGSSPKLLQRLTTVQEAKPVSSTSAAIKKPSAKVVIATSPTKTKFIVKSTTKISSPQPAPKVPTPQSHRPIILQEKIIRPEKPVVDAAGDSSVSVQKITSKRSMQDADDEIDSFIIQKEDVVDTQPPKKQKRDVAKPVTPVAQAPAISHNVAPKKRVGKAKILQQTIITPAGEIIQPTAVAPPASDDNIFDINSMPIVLSDQILTPESIENMPIFLSADSAETPASTATPTQSTTPKSIPATVQKSAGKPSIIKKHIPQQMRIISKTIAAATSAASSLIDGKVHHHKVMTPGKTTPTVLATPKTRIVKQVAYTPGPKPGNKYVLVTSQPSSAPSRFTVGKNRPVVKRTQPEITMTTTPTLTKVQNVSARSESSGSGGNKIMILTNEQGQQQRVLLTPAQQKMMGVGVQNQSPGRVTTKVIKGNTPRGHSNKELSGGQVVTIAGPSRTAPPVTTRLVTPVLHSAPKVAPQKTLGGRRLQAIPPPRMGVKQPQKLVLIKSQQGQTVRKIQGTDDALLNQQVAEQLEAIKASGVMLEHKPDHITHRPRPSIVNKSAPRRSYGTPTQVKKIVTEVPKPRKELVMPPLSPLVKRNEPIAPKDKVSLPKQAKEKPVDKDKKEVIAPEAPSERPLNQLVIQDSLGNQTTVIEGQILALPSETVDGQPQSYMLVTLDQSGNLTPLNNEALMSLDPSLALGGDLLGNAMLQIDQQDPPAAKEEAEPPANAVPEALNHVTTENLLAKAVDGQQQQQQQQELVVEHQVPMLQQQQEQVLQTVAGETGGGGQQLIVTGDPIAAQKFLESLTEGSADLANILASAEGSSILIHADGQQILINTDGDANQMLLTGGVTAADVLGGTSSEGDSSGNPMFATQPVPNKNQDILAAALADTDVFQQENGQGSKMIQGSQLSPGMYPIGVSNVLETSLTLNSPIMTPLEVPSTNTKKIVDESDILGRIPKNVDLPITITDPNISQTVAQQQQQVAALMASDLQNNLELTLPMSDNTISVASSDMNSPSFVYSLPSLDSEEMSHKPFNTSMPLLTEDTEDGGDTAVVSTKEAVPESEQVPSDKPTLEPPEDSGAKRGTEDAEFPEPSEAGSDNKLSDSFLDESEGLCTLGGEMCSSLSEPPPDMFDLSAVLSSHQNSKMDAVITANSEANDIDKHTDESSESNNTGGATTETTTQSDSSPPTTLNDENSCEIPVQPNIVTTLERISEVEEGVAIADSSSSKRGLEEDGEGDCNGGAEKKCKFD